MAKIETTTDLFLGGKVKLLQPADGYRAATDPVFLAASIRAKKGQRVLDVGCGVGAASFCLAARIQGLDIHGIDIQEDLIEIARENAVLNDGDGQFRFYQADLSQRPMEPEPNSFDHVMANPPFYEEGSGHRAPNEIKARAHMHEGASLSDWVDYMLRMTKPRGSLTFINRSERLEETMAAFKGRMGEIVLCPIWSQNPLEGKGAVAKRFLLQGRKGIKTPMKITGGLLVHEENGDYTQTCKDILMTGAGLNLNT